MQDNHTTPGSQPPGVDDQIVLEQVLLEAAKELPPLMLAGCMTVAGEVLPYAVGALQTICSWITTDGEHTIDNPFIWKDLETNDIYCRLSCAALEAIERAARIASHEGIVPAAAPGG